MKKIIPGFNGKEQFVNWQPYESIANKCMAALNASDDNQKACIIPILDKVFPKSGVSVNIDGINFCVGEHDYIGVKGSVYKHPDDEDDLDFNEVLHQFYDNTTGKLYMATDGGGVWILDTNDFTATSIRSATAVNIGDQLQNDFIRAIEVDTVGQIVYVALSSPNGFYWLDLLTLEGRIINSLNPSNGDNVADSPKTVTVNQTTGSVYSTVDSGEVWKYDKETHTGGILGTAVIEKVQYDQTSDKIMGYGDKLFVYDEVGDSITEIDNLTVVNGDAFPAEGLTAGYRKGDITWGCNLNQIWRYNISTNTGTNITNNTPINGDALPLANYYDIFISSDDRVYITTSLGIWVYDENNNVGKLLDTTTMVDDGETMPQLQTLRQGAIVEGTTLYTGSSTSGLYVREENVDVFSDMGLFFSRDAGATKVSPGQEKKGDELYCNTSKLGFSLKDTMRIDFEYLTY